jgi:hypothetical protein
MEGRIRRNECSAPTHEDARGWFVLYQPDYARPNVFNLHESGRFKHRPRIRRDCGARLVVRENLRIAVQYMNFVEEKIVDESTGALSPFVNRNGLVPLTRDRVLDLNRLEDNRIDDRIRAEIGRSYNEWVDSLARTKKGQIGEEELNRALIAAVERGRRICREWLIKTNMSWIQPFIPRMIHHFRYGIYERLGGEGFAEYTERGGEQPESDVVRKVNLFARIYERRVCRSRMGLSSRARMNCGIAGWPLRVPNPRQKGSARRSSR